MPRYSQAFKKTMVQKLTGPRAMNLAELAAEVGVSESSLYRWQEQAGTVPAVAKNKKTKKGSSAQAKRPQDWTPEQKLAAVMESSALSDEEIGEFLRRKGATRGAARTVARAARGRGARGVRQAPS